MTLPDAVRAAVEAHCGRVGAVHPVGGGCVSVAARVETASGGVFVKFAENAPPGMFAAEADGLRALAASPLVIPEVLAAGEGWLLLEWLEPGPGGLAHEEGLGRGVAALHSLPAGEWGWPDDNFIGSLPQANRGTGAWSDFWRARRLEPQLRQATALGRLPGTPEKWERLMRSLPGLLAGASPSLLHGDLWSGNALSTRRGPALVDPAVYRGHAEVDLAMARLFGGFADSFFRAYHEVRPEEAGAEVRRGIYQLYYLLVHVNLFGGAYVNQTARLLDRLAEAG